MHFHREVFFRYVQLSVLSALGGGASLLLLLVPYAKQRLVLPPTVTMVLEENGQPPPLLRSDGGDSLILSSILSQPCNILNNTLGQVTLDVLHCGHTCPVVSSPSGMPQPYKNSTSLVHLDGNRVFLPNDHSVALSCSHRCRLVRPQGTSALPHPTALQLTMVSSQESKAEVNVESGVGNETEYEGKDPASVWISGEQRLQPCRAACLVATERSRLCVKRDHYIVHSPQLTFWSYSAIRVLIGVIGGTAFAMFEGAVIALLRKHDADYGLQRIYAALGGMVASPLSGLLLDTASSASGGTDFR
ncbi:hypothetical protein J437_LFUL013976 [Ladona fulva]|uniref:Major facilitator superfamily associated domain-containing protein n=1 Tax=Ladona fulva TaxID=123851 RepID=A0A8K0KCJ7_LADFU|nr:hypothetical protein J437_LFUL013976 [Ladona fulva]